MPSRPTLTPRLLISALVLAAAPSFAAVSVERLRCEYLENPLGIDAAKPRLSWILKADGRGETQTAYQILVAASADALAGDKGDLWDSGEVRSDRTTFIEYGGKPPASRQTCYWKVRSWDKDGGVSPWSETATWEMGILRDEDWQAEWIARTADVNDLPAPYFRKELVLDAPVRKARAYICGLGYHELSINGRKVGDHLLDPGFTRYDRRALYVTHDVTPFFKQGANAVGVVLGHGWFNCQTKAVWNFHEAPWREAPKLRLSLVIETTDGRTRVVGSDGTWKTRSGPITFNSIYGGEQYDARLEAPGWDQPGFDDAAWQPAIVVSAPKGRLAAQMMPPIRASRTVRPVKLTEPKPGVFVFDMGLNFSGVTELKVSGPAGATVQLRHGERLFSDGTLDNVDNEKHVKKLGKDQPHQTSRYTLKGGGLETWRPRFTYYGFQYVEVTGFPGKPTLDSLEGVFLHTDVPAAGSFECSNPLLNKIWQAARVAYLSNLLGIPTDCPHREKNGWTGDAHLAAEQAIFNFMPAGIYTKWVNDLGDEQKPGGQLPGIVPSAGWGYTWGNGPAWDSAYPLIPFYLYEYYGDDQPLRDHYDGLKRYVDYLTSRAVDDIVNIGLNDWAPYKTKTPADITDTAYYYRDTQVVALAASLLGKHEDAARYKALAERIKASFNRKFFNAETGSYGNGSQTSLSCALYQGLVAPEHQARVLQNLVAGVEQRNGHIDTGILGAKYILNALTDHGRADVAYRMASQKTQPSWGWWIEQGATTLWEQWNGTESRNHIMFGEISAWFYKALAGINPDPAAPGFKHFLIRPQPVGDLTSARADYDSIHGRITSEWKITDGKFHLRVVVPPNTSATVHVPGATAEQVREGDHPAAGAPGVKSAGQIDGSARFEVGSGEYRFVAPKNP